MAVRVQQVGPELLTEPQVAAAVLAHGLDVEVAAGQQPVARAFVDDVPGHVAMRVAERDRVLDLDLPGPARAVSQFASTAYRRSRNDREFAFEPKPLSGMAPIAVAAGSPR